MENVIGSLGLTLACLTQMCIGDQSSTPFDGTLCNQHQAVFCDDHRGCYHGDQRCDGKEDCSDGSDEGDQCPVRENNPLWLWLMIPILIAAVGALMGGLLAFRWRKQKQTRREIHKNGGHLNGINEEGQALNGNGVVIGNGDPLGEAGDDGAVGEEGEEFERKCVQKPEGFTLARDGNSMWAGHPEYYYTD